MRLRSLSLFVFISYYIPVVTGDYKSTEEYGSYVNPNRRPYEVCDSSDLVTLSSCSNQVLYNLDGCKADDLACECCALQHIRKECYSLCPGNPSSNFLAVLLKDCSNFNEINACALPFKKEDTLNNVVKVDGNVAKPLRRPSKVKGIQENDDIKLSIAESAERENVSELLPKNPGTKIKLSSQKNSWSIKNSTKFEEQSSDSNQMSAGLSILVATTLFIISPVFMIF